MGNTNQNQSESKLKNIHTIVVTVGAIVAMIGVIAGVLFGIYDRRLKADSNPSPQPIPNITTTNTTTTTQTTTTAIEIDNADDFEYTIKNNEVTIVKYIGNDSNVIIPSIIDGYPVTIIGEEAFWEYEKLENMNIPNSVTTIEARAFDKCIGLTSVDIPNSVTDIGDWSFSHCDKLKSITLGTGVNNIGVGAFYASAIKNITIPNCVTTIGKLTFSRCVNLISISIPNSVEYIGDEIFDVCTNLSRIDVSTDNNTYSSVDGILYNKNQTMLIRYPEGKKEAIYDIPCSVTTIDGRAFGWCKNLMKINADVNSINYSSIDGVLFNKEQTVLIKYSEGRAETSYDIPNSIIRIESRAFGGTKLTNINIPYGVTSIGYSALSGCNITSLEIPESVERIEDCAFWGCRNLVSVTIPSSVIQIQGKHVFYDCPNVVIYGYTGSEAERYATDNSIRFVPL